MFSCFYAFQKEISETGKEKRRTHWKVIIHQSSKHRESSVPPSGSSFFFSLSTYRTPVWRCGEISSYLCSFYLKKHRLLQMGRIFLFQLMWKVHKNETNKTLDKSKVLISTVYAVVTDMIPTPLKPNILCVVLWSARSSFEKLWCSGSAIQEAISILIWSSNLPAEWKWRCSLKELFDLAQIWKSNSYQFYVWTIMHKNTIISLNLKYTRQVIKK